VNYIFGDSRNEEIAYYRDFAEKELRPYVRQMDIEEKTPAHIIQRLKECGMLGIPMDKKYGGAGKDFVSSCICSEEFSKVSPAVASIVSISTVVATDGLRMFGTEKQKIKYVSQLASGDKIGSFAITEAGAGSDTAAAKTTAVLDGDHYVINGSKIFISNSELSGIFLIGAQTNLPDGKRKLSMFIVEKEFPGFAIGKHEKKMGIRASSTCELILEDCIVPKENLLGELGKGQKIALSCLDGGRATVGAQAVGIAQGAIDETISYLKTNAARTDKLINKQGVQFKLADLQTRTDAARLMVYRAAILWDQKKNFSREAAMAKLYASEIANEVSRECVQIMGYEGCTTDYLVESMMRDAKITEIYEGTNEIQRLVIAGLMGLKV
jgi:butyryl-CoA dehydrogenase